MPEQEATLKTASSTTKKRNGIPKPKVIVSGALANKPYNGGNAWTRLSWVLGFKRLGYDVLFVELIDSSTCIGEADKQSSFFNSVHASYFRRTMEEHGLSKNSALILDDGEQVLGCPMPVILDWAEQSELLINISGHLSLSEIRNRVRRRVYFDDDPGYTQFWQAMGSDASHLEEHTHFYTLGLNIGDQICCIPTQNVPWRPIFPPVVLSDWPVTPRDGLDRFTTIASWRGAYGPIYYEGVHYGLKVHEFRKFITLPKRLDKMFEIALQIHPADENDRNTLIQEGWTVLNALETTESPSDFRDYVQTSAAEFSVAQGIYVQTNSGWFSDRTVRYLASGRPALVQDTGFSQHLPSELGLHAFRTMDEAVDGARAIENDYQRHCLEARQIAKHYFDSDIVIGNLLVDIGVKKAAGPHAT